MQNLLYRLAKRRLTTENTVYTEQNAQKKSSTLDQA